MWFSASSNKVGLKDFLGLSPEQMHILRYSKWEELGPVITVHSDIEAAILLNVQDVLLLLSSMSGGELKATPRGFFPKKVARAIYHQQRAREWKHRFGLVSEDYCPCVMVVRFVATDCGWMKLILGRFSLTKAGKNLLEGGFNGGHFSKLLEAWLRHFNWSYLDGYPDCSFARNEALFLLFAITRHGRAKQSSRSLAQDLLTAFPMIEEEVPASALHPDNFTPTLVQFVDQIVSLRFIERSCRYFGFVKTDGLRNRFGTEESCRFETTEFLDKIFTWNVSDEQIKNAVEGMPKVSQAEIQFILEAAANELAASSGSAKGNFSDPPPSGWMVRPPTKH